MIYRLAAGDFQLGSGDYIALSKKDEHYYILVVFFFHIVLNFKICKNFFVAKCLNIGKLAVTVNDNVRDTCTFHQDLS